MARPSRRTFTPTSVTSLLRLRGYSPQPARASALRKAAAVLLLAAAVALPCTVLYRAAVDTTTPVYVPRARRPWLERHPTLPPVTTPDEDSAVDPVPPGDLESEDLRLELVLQEASMANKTVLLTTLNAAWASPGSVIDLFINSFRRGIRTSSLLRHLVIVTFDWKAYKRCVKIHPYCFALVTEDVGFSQEKRFLTSGYLEMMWKRLDFLRLVLEKGYSFIFSDADIMWFRNPFPYFYPDGDFQIACDHYVGNETDLRNIANGGFNYVKSNEQSIEFYKFWYSSRLRYPGYHDQDVFNFIKHDPYITDIGLTIKFLSTMYFGGICEPSRDLNKPFITKPMRHMLMKWKQVKTAKHELSWIVCCDEILGRKSYFMVNINPPWLMWKKRYDFIFDRSSPSLKNWKMGFLKSAFLQAHRMKPDEREFFANIISLYS